MQKKPPVKRYPKEPRSYVRAEIIRELEQLESLDRVQARMQGKTLQNAIRILILAKQNREIDDSQFMRELRKLVDV